MDYIDKIEAVLAEVELLRDCDREVQTEHLADKLRSETNSFVAFMVPQVLEFDMNSPGNPEEIKVVD